jgi:hypothetical protein
MRLSTKQFSLPVLMSFITAAAVMLAVVARCDHGDATYVRKRADCKSALLEMWKKIENEVDRTGELPRDAQGNLRLGKIECPAGSRYYFSSATRSGPDHVIPLVADRYEAHVLRTSHRQTSTPNALWSDGSVRIWEGSNAREYETWLARHGFQLSATPR